MTAPGTQDPTDSTPAGPLTTLEKLKVLVRPMGCYVTYGLTGLWFGVRCATVLLKIDVSTETDAAMFAFLQQGWAHVYQYTWARTSEKKLNADT